MTSRVLPAATALLLLAVLAGCGGSEATVSAPPPAAVSATSPAPCPAAGPSAAEWPLAVPAALPKPPGAAISASNVEKTATYVRFTTPTSLRESVLFVVRELPPAGFTLDKGDAESFEADAPFTGPGVFGALKMVLTGACTTSWVLAVVPRADPAAPRPAATLIPFAPGASAGPLPAG